MSQAKVNRYKEEKANRKKTIAKHKLEILIAKIVACVAVVALVGWAGFAGYQYWEDKQPAKTIECTTTPIDDYLNTVAY